MQKNMILNQSKKRIAIIAAYMYGGGAERAAGLLSKYLCTIYDVYLFLTDTDYIVYEYGGNLVDIGIDGPDYFEYYIDFYKKKYEIDCAISFTEQFNFANIRTKRKEKVIISERCVQSLLEDPLCHENYQIRALYNLSDAIVSVAEGVKYDLVRSYGVIPDKITTIYNFIDQEVVREKASLAEEFDLDDFLGDSKLIVNIGRLERQKNQKKLIRQFAYLLRDNNKAKLLIIGSGALKKELLDLIDELKLEKYVKILSYCRNPFPYLKRAIVFVLASKNEGLPNVLLEAMCLGIPVVSVDCMSGPRELLAGETSYERLTDNFMLCERGILVSNAITDDTGETTYLKDALAFALENLEEKESISEVIKNELSYMRSYSNEKIVQNWVDVIETPQNINAMEYADLLSGKKVVVYGAGDYGRRMVAQLIGDGIEIVSVVVSDLTNNPSFVHNIPVRQIDDFCSFKEELTIVIGVSVRYQSDVVEKLLSMGFDDIHFVCLRRGEEV